MKVLLGVLLVCVALVLVAVVAKRFFNRDTMVGGFNVTKDVEPRAKK